MGNENALTFWGLLKTYILFSTDPLTSPNYLSSRAVLHTSRIPKTAPVMRSPALHIYVFCRSVKYPPPEVCPSHPEKPEKAGSIIVRYYISSNRNGKLTLMLCFVDYLLSSQCCKHAVGQERGRRSRAKGQPSFISSEKLPWKFELRVSLCDG